MSIKDIARKLETEIWKKVILLSKTSVIMKKPKLQAKNSWEWWIENWLEWDHIQIKYLTFIQWNFSNLMKNLESLTCNTKVYMKWQKERWKWPQAQTSPMMCSPQGSTKLTTLGKMILKREKERRQEMDFGMEVFNYIDIL